MKFTEGRLDPGAGLAQSALIPGDDCAPGTPGLYSPWNSAAPGPGFFNLEKQLPGVPDALEASEHAHA